ncbi:MAG: hypothetical protein Harvfovirus5_51 [Harvfovirus sp.]|uniref:Uncharacterized protein n=1 Tax=Harvfovirus sp. TaxID=2487768 RepID=A0A3G5A0N1_9VIRU|nr:MAG: hypothetical protein Harvfovirus5_51 [Harvfovirus sp.]
MKPVRPIGGFNFCQGNVFPTYWKSCSDCGRPPPTARLELSMDTLGILDRTPEEIKAMTAEEIKQFQLLLPKASVVARDCPCKIGGESAPLVTNAISAGRRHPRGYTDFTLGVRTDLFCECAVRLIESSLKQISWSCPYCCAIVCDPFCFSQHFRENHSNVETELAIPQRAIGGHWCPLCRQISHDGAKSKQLEGTLLHSKITTGIKNQQGFSIGECTVRNVICIDCDEWEEKKLEIPVSLREHFRGRDFYSVDAEIPRFVLLEPIKLQDLLIEDFDMHATFLICLIKQKYFPESITFVIDHEGRGINFYTTLVWRSILNQQKEITATSIPGAALLASIRGEIALFDRGINETSLPPVLRTVIVNYMPMQLWYFESMMAKIQNDALRYGPSMRALLSVIGEIPR